MRLLTKLHQSCPDPFRHSSWHGLRRPLEGRKHSSNSHPESLFVDTDCPETKKDVEHLAINRFVERYRSRQYHATKIFENI